MIYIIDANNLAGCLGLLDKKNWSDILISDLRKFFFDPKNIVFLVFDGCDFWGDISCIDNLIIVESPRDDDGSADKKILEIVSKITSFKQKQDLLLITDDIELKQEVGRLADERRFPLRLKKASVFVFELRDFLLKAEKTGEIRDLDDSEINKINRELLDIWS